MKSGWSGVGSAPRWYCVVVAAFLALRAVSTLIAGASFAQPGDGWRSLWQLAMVAVLTVGAARASASPAAVAAVGLVYAVASGMEFVHGTDLLGVIPVDMRDRLVHPLLAVLAAGCLLVARLRRARLSNQR